MGAVMETLRGAVLFLLILINTIVAIIPIIVFTFLKLLIPIKPWRVFVSALLVRFGENWISRNSLILTHLTPFNVTIEGQEGLSYGGWYMVTCNHQSWTDILVLQHACNRRVPFLKFFLKQELIWVPLMGIAWWALDFPFMKRFSKEYLARNPHMKGKDLETTRKACEKFKDIPVSVMNFLEGTRFTRRKHDEQQSPYTYLLKPKAGGIAFVLSSMGGHLKSMLDVTIVYHDRRIEFWDLLCGRVNRVTVRIQQRDIPAEFQTGDYENDAAYRQRFQAWVGDIWSEKDALIGRMKAAGA